MKNIFPEPIIKLPEAEIPMNGGHAYLSQGSDHQILFMEFAEDVIVPNHSHESQWGIVVEGCIDLTIGEIKRTYTKGDHYYIPKGVEHSATIYSGYADVTFFSQKDRYTIINFSS